MGASWRQSRAVSRRDWLRAGGVALAGGVAGCGSRESPNSGPVVPVTEASNHPFAFRQDGRLRGFEIRLTELVCERADVPLADWKQYDKRSLRKTLARDEVDLVASTIPVERDYRSVTTTDRYYSQDQVVLLAESREDDPTKLRHLYRDTVGVRLGTAGESQIRRLIREDIIDAPDFRQFDSYRSALDGLRVGRVDALFVDRPIGRLLVRSHPVRIGFHVETGEGYGYLVRSDDPRAEAIESVLGELRPSDRYDRLVTDWFLADLSPDSG